jgi:2-oxo-3-hexenedioate decarboxylase
MSEPAPLSPDQVDAFAQRLDDAQQNARSVPMLTAESAFSVSDGYRIQRAGIALRKLRGDTLVGMKMGLTSLAKMKQMNVSEPIYGHLTRHMLLEDGGRVKRADHVHPRVEPEIVFLLARDLEGPVTPAQALMAVDGICCALELIDSRYQDFKFTLPDVVADNASSSRFVLGSTVRARDFDVANLGMVMEKNGQLAEAGSSSAILEHPARSLAAMANQLVPHGEKLKAGSIVLAGGATAAIPLQPGDHVRLRVEDLGRVDIFCD